MTICNKPYFISIAMLSQGVPDSLDLVPIAAFEGKGKRKGCCLIVPVIVVIFLYVFSRTGSKYF